MNNANKTVVTNAMLSLMLYMACLLPLLFRFLREKVKKTRKMCHTQKLEQNKKMY
jgi:hypothetical protein